MSTKFFNNTTNNTLFDKLKGIASEMVSFDPFYAARTSRGMGMNGLICG